MLPHLFLEPLEDRALPSGWNGGAVVPPRPDATAVEIQNRLIWEVRASETQVMGDYSPGANSMMANDADFSFGVVDHRWPFAALGVEEYGPHHRAEVLENHRLVEFDVVSPLAILEKNSLGEGGPKNGSSETRTALASQAQTTLPNPVSGESNVPPQPPSFRTTTANELVLAQDAIFSTDGTAEVAVPGPFSDSVFLDAWQEGLSSPSTALVPVTDKDLTFIAAYLVGTPIRHSTAKVPPAINPEIDLTNFIVGHEDLRSSKRTLDSIDGSDAAPTPRLVGMLKPVVLDRGAIVPTSIEADANERIVVDEPPREEGNRPSEGRQEIGPVAGEDEE